MSVSLKHSVDNLAIDIELKLPGGRVADADRTRGFESRQPRYVPFRQPPFAADAVHDLQLIRPPGNRAYQPVSPRARLFVITGSSECQQRESRIPQPTIAIVPITYATGLFGQRSRRRGDHAAGRPAGQRLQYGKRALDRLGPAAGRSAAIAPSPPKFFGLG